MEHEMLLCLISIRSPEVQSLKRNTRTD